MSGLKKLIDEIHGRSLWQVLGIYLAGSWVTLQVIDQLTQGSASDMAAVPRYRTQPGAAPCDA